MSSTYQYVTAALDDKEKKWLDQLINERSWSVSRALRAALAVAHFYPELLKEPVRIQKQRVRRTSRSSRSSQSKRTAPADVRECA